MSAPFLSYSQAGQDRFAYEVLGQPTSGMFIDLGMNDPVVKNNTYGLEKMGMTGLLVDMDEYCRELYTKSDRIAPYWHTDATRLDWNAIIAQFGNEIDYLSLDVDPVSLATLKNIPLDRIRFKCITIEHDRYRFGDADRNEMRRALWHADYLLVASDVKDAGCEFEDWWVDPKFIPAHRFGRFISLQKEWKEIFE